MARYDKQSDIKIIAAHDQLPKLARMSLIGCFTKTQPITERLYFNTKHVGLVINTMNGLVCGVTSVKINRRTWNCPEVNDSRQIGDHFEKPSRQREKDARIGDLPSVNCWSAKLIFRYKFPQR